MTDWWPPILVQAKFKVCVGVRLGRRGTVIYLSNFGLQPRSKRHLGFAGVRSGPETPFISVLGRRSLVHFGIIQALGYARRGSLDLHQRGPAKEIWICGAAPGPLIENIQGLGSVKRGSLDSHQIVKDWMPTSVPLLFHMNSPQVTTHWGSPIPVQAKFKVCLGYGLAEGAVSLSCRTWAANPCQSNI